MKRVKDKEGLYYRGELVATGYISALKELYQLEEISDQFCVSTDYMASGYSIVDNARWLCGRAGKWNTNFSLNT